MRLCRAGARHPQVIVLRILRMVSWQICLPLLDLYCQMPFPPRPPRIVSHVPISQRYIQECHFRREETLHLPALRRLHIQSAVSS